jgi:hypothetical protein
MHGSRRTFRRISVTFTIFAPREQKSEQLHRWSANTLRSGDKNTILGLMPCETTKRIFILVLCFTVCRHIEINAVDI